MRKAIQQINSSKSQGPDMFHSKLVKETQPPIIGPLTIFFFFQKSINEGKFPHD